MSKPVGRAKIKGTGRHEKKFVRQAYNYEFKLAVVDHFTETKNVRATVERYFPGASESAGKSKRKLVYKWHKQRALIEFAAGNTRLAGHQRMRDIGLSTILPRDAEALLVKWVNDYRRDGVPISALMLQLKAEEVARGFGIPSGRFSGTWRWLRGFKKRHRLSFRAKTHTGQITPPDAMERATAFAKAVAARAVAEGITVIYNADQTGVNFELLPRTTLSPTESKTVWIKCGKMEKERMTVMLLGDSTGRKYLLFLVMKTAMSKKDETRAENAAKRHGFGKRLRHQLEPLQEEHNVRIYGNQSAWWTGGLTVEFLRYHFRHRDVFSQPVMLLLDDFSGHWVSEVGEYATTLNVVMMKVPPGLTWLCQPADAVWIKPVKDRLRRHWVEHLRRQLDAHRDGAGDQPFSMVPPCRATVA
ncbi:hypothetical protein BBJ28_00011896 [Nothophytophthora sp. Chile5]|nr:hypothetical protein BBJ28_00011896 [Nothophytophthora sp. Chile5]